MRLELVRLKRKVQALDANWNAENFLSLALAITHEVEITPEQAQRAIIGTVTLKPTNQITPELVLDAIQFLQNNPGTSLTTLEKKFKCNRYDLYISIKQSI